MKWERPFLNVFLPQIEKLVQMSGYADRNSHFQRLSIRALYL